MAIAGVGTFWAFLLAWFDPRRRGRWRAVAAGAGVIASAGIAVARPDSAVYLGVSLLAVLLLRLPVLRRHAYRLLLVAVLAVPLAFAAVVRLPPYLGPFLNRSAYPLVELPDWFTWIHIAEWPYLVAQVFGFPMPRYLPYFYELGYTMSFGWDRRAGLGTETELPTLVVIAAATAVLLVVGWGLQSYSWRKLTALGVLIASLVVASFGFLAASGYVLWVQARYYVPIVIVIVGILAYAPARLPRPRRLVIGLVCLASSLAGFASLATLIRRSTNGQPVVPELSWRALTPTFSGGGPTCH